MLPIKQIEGFSNEIEAILQKKKYVNQEQLDTMQNIITEIKNGNNATNEQIETLESTVAQLQEQKYATGEFVFNLNITDFNDLRSDETNNVVIPKGTTTFYSKDLSTDINALDFIPSQVYIDKLPMTLTIAGYTAPLDSKSELLATDSTVTTIASANGIESSVFRGFYNSIMFLPTINKSSSFKSPTRESTDGDYLLYSAAPVYYASIMLIFTKAWGGYNSNVPFDATFRWYAVK